MTAELLVEFDHHGPAYRADPISELHRMRSSGELIYTEAHGGYWVAVSYEAVAEIAGDDRRFSSLRSAEEPAFRGVVIPGPQGDVGFGALPIESDPPLTTELRAIMHPYFNPRNVTKWLPQIEHWTHVTIDGFIERGSLDIVDELALPIPGLFMSSFIGLPLEQWHDFAHLAHLSNAQRPGTPESAEMQQRIPWIAQQLAALLEERRRNPKDDLISVIANAELYGEPLDMVSAVSLITLTLFGAFDTTTGILTHSLIHLSEQPEHRQRLIDEPDLIPTAVEEFLRWYSPTQHLARTVTEDTTVRGVPLRSGDRVLISWMGANHDSAQFEEPDRIVLDRFPNKHVSFGLGAHRCMGSNFARAEVSLVLGIILDRLPDLTVDTARIERYASVGQVNGLMHVPATFTPGTKLFPHERLPGMDGD